MRLLIRSAKPIAESVVRAPGPCAQRLYSPATPCTLARIACSSACDLGQPQRARAASCPASARPRPRTKARGAATAPVAMPSQHRAQRMCETGTIVCAAMSAKGTGEDLLHRRRAVDQLTGGLHVPRMPSVSQVPVLLELVVLLLEEHQHLVARRRSRARAAR